MKILNALDKRLILPEITSWTSERGVIPHGKTKEVGKIPASFGKHARRGFQSLDGKPNHLFFLLIAPENSVGMHSKMLAQIARLMKDPAFRKRLMEARSSEEIHGIFSEGVKKV